jgi:hypothetical protein
MKDATRYLIIVDGLGKRFDELSVVPDLIEIGPAHCDGLPCCLALHLDRKLFFSFFTRPKDILQFVRGMHKVAKLFPPFFVQAKDLILDLL